MKPKTLRELYECHQGKISDKWSSYLETYDEILAPYRFKPVRILEIGVQNGGSLEIWGAFFPQALTIIGCDIDPRCQDLRFDDRRIRIVAGDANTDAVQREIMEDVGSLDIVIDDGSHRSSDIVHSFVRYFPKVEVGGLYIIEDLHASYWQSHEGGLFQPYSAQSFLKRLADVINHEHWRIGATRGELFASFSSRLDVPIDDAVFEGIRSVEFFNSMCIIRKGAVDAGQVGPRFIAGLAEALTHDARALHGRPINGSGDLSESVNASNVISPLPEIELDTLRHDVQKVVAQYDHRVRALDESARRLQSQLDASMRREGLLLNDLKQVQRDYAAIVQSRTWRVARKLNEIARRYPRLVRWIWQAVKSVRLVARLRFREFRDTLMQRRMHQRLINEVESCQLFDAQYYVQMYLHAVDMAGGAARHFALYGAREKLNPHPLIDTQWYVSQYPDAAATGVNPLLHYAAHPELQPNPLFDGQWYLEHNPDARSTGMHPLVHYMRHGATEGRDPSSRFSTLGYLDEHPELKESGINPLAHALASKNRSRLLMREEPVFRSEIRCLKSPDFAAETALFATYSPDGRLKPHVRHYIASLRKVNVSVVLIVAADAPFDPEDELFAAIDGLFVRRAAGLDFAAWAHVLRLRPDLLDARILYLLNDSLIGPFNQPDFERMMDRLRTHHADVIGLTGNTERGAWHLQSYFLALRSTALASVAFQSFLRRIQTLLSKDEVIDKYELTLADTLKKAGLECAALFPPEAPPRNRTIFAWRELIDEGFPFIKVMTLRDEFPDVDIGGWREVIRARGFDVELAEQVVEEARTIRPTPHDDRPVSPVPQVPFTPPGSPRRVALIAPFNFDNGLGMAARSYISALRRTGWLVNLHPVDRPFHVHRQITPPFEVRDFEGDADVVLIQINPDSWHVLLSTEHEEIIARAQVRIGLWVWETPVVPESWRQVMNRVDAIWAPSRYCAQAFSKVVGVPVHVVPYVVALHDADADAVAPATAIPELQGSTKYVLYAFDGSSYLVRKNPFALVRAFDMSGLHERGWQLVLKTKHIHGWPAQSERLTDIVAQTPGAVLLDRSLDKEAMHALMAGADIYASSHCAEGFGLTVAESMAMGKPVVATDFSGTTDFLDAQTGYPVAYTLDALKGDHGAYAEGSVWATVDEAALSQALIDAEQAVDSGDGTRTQAARQRIHELLSPEAVAQRMRASLDLLLPATAGAYL